MTGRFGSGFFPPQKRLTPVSKWRMKSIDSSIFREANNSRNSENTKELIESYMKPRIVSRNARLALLRYYLIHTPDNAQIQEKLFSACREYFMDYCTKVICFRDLQPYVSRLEKSLQEKFLGIIARDIQGFVCSDKASEVRILSLIIVMAC